jgi:hypothetical protein
MRPTRPFGRIFWIWRRNGWNFLICSNSKSS